MKNRWRKRIAVTGVVAACVFAGKGICANAMQVTTQESQTSVSIAQPCVLDGEERMSDASYKNYIVNFNNNEKANVVVPIVATKAGLISCKVTNASNIVTGAAVSGAGVTVGIYEDSECTVPVGEAVTKGMEKNELLYEGSFENESSMIYFVKVSVAEEVQTEAGDFSVQLALQQVNADNRTLKDDQWSSVYTVKKKKEVYYKIKLNQDGCVRVMTALEEASGDASLVLCNSKKNEISLKTTNKKTSPNTSVYAVAKGTYYLKVSKVKGYYRVKYTFEKLSEKSGATQKKAKSIKVGGNAVAGAVLLGDSTSTYDWYKFTLKSASKVKFTLKGSTTGSNKIKVEIVPPKKDKNGKKVKFQEDPVFSVSGIDKKVSATSNEWPSGVWYVKINKSAKKGSGVYTLKISTVS